MQLLQFFHTLNRAKSPKMNGQPVTRFAWEDDGDETPALRVLTPDHNVLVLTTDRIKCEDNMVTVSVGAKDYEFTVS